MNPEFERITARGCGWLPHRVTFYVSAVWVGCQIGGFALAAGLYLSRWKLDEDIVMSMVASPLLLANGAFCANVVVLGVAFGRFLSVENLSFRGWATFAGIESFFALVALYHGLRGVAAYATTLGVWLVLVTMMGTATWFLHRLHLDQRSGEWEMLKSENAARRARQEERYRKDPTPDD
jgi:hypothetical protein